MTKEAAAAATTTAVQVALRIRPLTERDRAQPRFANLSNDDVLRIHEKTVHVVPHNKLFTFDHVFGTDSRQSEVFEALGPKLISKFTEGYNVTILAYGQTSSGKTYTMGTAQHQAGRYNMEEEGIVPRAMALLFDTLAAAGGSALTSSDRPITPAPSLSSSTDNTTGTRLRPPSRASHHARTSQQQQHNSNRKYSVRVSFVEIYNEELIDLLNPAPLNERPPVSIREDAKGHIYWAGVKEVSVNNTEDVLFYLEQGTRNRATGATDMNEKSSRSHAIFSVSLRQEKWVSRGNKASRDGEWMVTTSKFHFVDLAGSERLKRTAAEGERRKEGININAGLLALGNVISALGDPSKRSTHIPYRDSKLTRLLQDSLGGSATTLMIACASPAEYNLSETLNTLQYANRARNIKNRVEKNEVEEWMTSDNIELLRSMIGRLKAEVRNLKSGSLSSTGSTAAAAAAAGAVDHHHNHSLAVIGAGGAGDMDQVFQEQRLVIADLQRQVEELDGEASVTRERNRVVEAELKRLRKLEAVRRKEFELRQQQQQQSNKINDDFQHLVEPVIEEYEKSIVALESQLAMARAALNHSDIGFEEQRQKLEQCELLLENQDQTVLDLRSRLNKLQEREASNESYIDELEGKLVQSAKDARRDQELLNELKTRIMRFKETDENTEQYIFDLEQRLATSEAERHTIQETVEKLEKRLEERDATIDQLRNQLAKAEDTDTQKMMLQEIDHLELKCATLEKERDQLKAEVELLSVAQKEQLQRNQEQQEQLQRLSIPPPPSPLPRTIQNDQQQQQHERNSAASRRYADEEETPESKNALAVKLAEERLALETAKVTQLSQDLEKLQTAHHELQEVHDELLKENDEVLMRYQEVTDQLALLNRPDHSLDALSKEMSRAKDEAEMKELEERRGQIKVLETMLAEAEAKETKAGQKLEEALARQNELQQALDVATQRLQATKATQAALDANQAELEETRTRLAEVHQQLADLQAQHAVELSQSGALQTRLDETLAELEECKEQLTTQTGYWEKRFAETQAELERQVASKVEESKCQVTALQKQLAEAQADVERHQERLDASNAEADRQLTSLQQKLADAQADLDNHRELLHTKTTEGAILLERHQSTLAELEALQHAKSDLETLQRQMADAQVELERYKEAVDVNRQQREQDQAALEEKVKNSSEQAASLEKRLAEALAELDNQRQLVEGNHHKQLEEALTQLNGLKDELDATISENAQLRASIANFQKSMSRNDDELAKTKAELARCRQLLEDTRMQEKQHATVLEQRLNDTEEELARFRSSNMLLDGQISQLQQQLTATTAELEQSVDGPEATLLKRQLIDAQDTLDRYIRSGDQIADLKQRLAETEAKLEDSIDNGAQKALLEQQLKDIQDELQQHKASKALASDQLSELREHLSATQAELLERRAADDDSLVQLQQRYAELEKRAEIKQHQLMDVQQELERYKAMASEFEQRLDDASMTATANGHEHVNHEMESELDKTRARVKELETLLQQQQQRDMKMESPLAQKAGSQIHVDEHGDMQAHQAALELKDKAIAELQQDLDILEEALAQAEDRQKRAEQEHLSLLDEVTLENDQLARRIKELEQKDQSARQTLESRIQQLEEMHEADQSIQQALEERIKQLEAEVQQQQQQQQQAARSPSPSMKVGVQQALEQEYEEHVAALREEIDLAQATNAEKDGHLRTLRSQLEAQARRIAELEDRAVAAEFERKVVVGSTNANKDEISKLYEERMGALEQKTRVLEEENKEYQTLSEELEAEVSRLIKKEEQDSKAREAAIAAAVAAKEKQMTAAFQAANSQAETRISALEAQLVALEKAKQDAGGQVADAQAMLADAQARLADAERRAQAELGAERKAREQAERTLASLENQMEEMINKKSKFMCF